MNLPLLSAAQEKRERAILLMGYVEDSFTGEALRKTLVELYKEDGSLVDSTRTSLSFMNGERRAVFNFKKVASGNYNIRFSKTGYQRFDLPLTLKVSSRETERSIKPVLLKKNPKEIMLKEATVTASKVKFFYKGDTLVYDADAFQLSQGSMLDALIKQLPGVTLDERGRIRVNGRFVESLLLNGQDFFRKDRSIMLENLPAYTVKNIKVYKRDADEMLRMIDRESIKKSLVMDVILKRKYSIGWLANTEWGYGSEDRYLGRLFALRFTPHSRIALVGNLNNINDSRKPGEDNSWTPDQLSTGLQRYKMAGLDYAVNFKGTGHRVSGEATMSRTDADNRITTNQENFLQGGNTYQRELNRSEDRNVLFQTRHELMLKLNNNVGLAFKPEVRYRNYSNRGGLVAGTFNEDPENTVTTGLIDSLFRPMTGETLRRILLNRNVQTLYGRGNALDATAKVELRMGMPRSKDYLSADITGSYVDERKESFRHNLLEYASEASDFRNEYTFMRPERGFSLRANAEYMYRPASTEWILFARYDFAHQNITNRRAFYRLEKLSGWGIDTENRLGSLPSTSDWKNRTIDDGNSYDAEQSVDAHTLTINGAWHAERHRIKWEIDPWIAVSYLGKRMEYRMTENTQRPSRYDVLLNPGISVAVEPDRKVWPRLTVGYELQSEQPDLFFLTDTRNDMDPLNVTLGNPNLKNPRSHQFKFRLTKLRRQDWIEKYRMEASLYYTRTENAIAMGYHYDRTTGIRTMRPENIDGNWELSGTLGGSASLDKKQQWNLQLTIDPKFFHSVDLADYGTGDQSAHSIIESFYTDAEVKLNYSQKKYDAGLRVKGRYGNISGERNDFLTIRTGDVTYGLTGHIKLPWEVEINTDLNLYSRYGYNDPAMNTNDLVWNARISKSLLKGNLLLSLDGFDMLHNLSNVTRTLNAQGRTETYRNVIPSYVMLHAIYRLNIQPKKKTGE